MTTNETHKKCVLIFSGGLDSTTLLYKLINDEYDVKTLTFNYAQKHKKEINCASKICALLKISNYVIDVSCLREILGDSALLGGKEIPWCHYTEESSKQTIVPNRNMIMLAIAAGFAEAHEIQYLFYAAHKNDSTIYPDCRYEFVEALKPAIHLATAWHPVELRAPFINMTKAEIIRIGLKLKVPYELTWSCYAGEEKPCLKCPTCIERKEAFDHNNIEDPLCEII